MKLENIDAVRVGMMGLLSSSFLGTLQILIGIILGVLNMLVVVHVLVKIKREENDYKQKKRFKLRGVFNDRDGI